MKDLLKEGDGLADNKDTTEAVLKLQAGVRTAPARASASSRSRTEVKRDVTAREDLKKVLMKEIDEDQTPAEFRTGELSLKVLGFIPRR